MCEKFPHYGNEKTNAIRSRVNDALGRVVSNVVKKC